MSGGRSVAPGLPLWWSAASGPPRVSLASMRYCLSSGVSQSKLERRYVSSMSDMLGSSTKKFYARPSCGDGLTDLRDFLRIAAALRDR